METKSNDFGAFSDTILNLVFFSFSYSHAPFFNSPFGKNSHKKKMLGGDVLNGHNRNHVQGEQKENWRLVVFIYLIKKWIR